MLTDAACRKAAARETDYRLSDSLGLYLLVRKSASKSWAMRYYYADKEKKLTIGPYPEISLKEARDSRDAARAELRAGVDPSAAKRAQRDKAKADAVDSFESCALAWHEAKSAVLSPRYAKAVLSRLRKNTFRHIGVMPVRSVTVPDVLKVLRAVEARGARRMAQKVRQHMSEVFVWAISSGLAENDPAAIVKRALAPANPQLRPASLSIADARTILIKVEASSSAHWATLLASRLTALTAARPGVVRLAERSEFVGLDGDEPVWRIPAAKMKLAAARKEDKSYDFLVPLSRQAREVVLAAMQASLSQQWLFPGVAGWRKPISDSTMSKLYREQGFTGRHVPHGWRASFSTIMNELAAKENRPGDRDVIDMMLAHIKGDVEAAYNRAAYMPRRRELAQAWADMLMKDLLEPVTLVAHLRA